MKNKHHLAGRRRFAALLFMGLGACLLAAALLLLWDARAADRRAGDAAREILARMPIGEPAPAGPGGTESFPPPSSPESGDGWDALAGQALGVLEIPALNLTLPVLADCTDSLLESSVCRYAGAPPDEEGDGASAGSAPGFVIAGHSYESQFAGLARLQPGDAVLFRGLSGNETRYLVESREEISADPAELHADAWPLTLFTCTFDGSARFLIRCSRP